MAFNVTGLRQVTSDLDTEGLTRFDTSGLKAYEPTISHDVPPSTTSKAPTDSWGQLGLKFLQNAPTMFKQVGGGLLQALAESKPTAPNLSIANDPQWQEYVDWHGQVTQAAREAGTLPGQQMFDEATADLQANAPNVDDSFIKRFAYDVSQGIVQMVPALTASFLAKSPALGASVIGTQVYGPKYAESRAAGRSEGAATADAVFYGLAEGIPEMIPLGLLIKPGGKFLWRTLGVAGAEGIQEMVTEVFQSGYDAGILDEDMTFLEAITSIEYWQRVGYAGLVGAFVGGGLAISTQPFVPAGEQQRPPPDDAETVTPDEVRDFASKRQADLEGAPSLQPRQQQELDFLRDNKTNPTAIADAYGAKLEPTGERERAVAATPPLTQADIDSPIPTDLIAEGKEIFQDALGGQSANKILSEAGFPPINSRVTVEMDAGSAVATVVDAWDENGVRGVKLRFDDGRIKSEPFEFLTGRVTPITEEADAQKIRSDQEEVSRRRQEREGREDQRRPDLQLPAEARPEAGDQIPQAPTPVQEEGRTAEPAAEIPEIKPIEEAPALVAEARIDEFVKQPDKRQAKALRELALQAGWSEIGGRIIRKTEDPSSPDYSEIVGRTKWLPRADWWPGRPGGFNEKQTAHIIEKGINGKLLGKKQREYFEFLTEIADEMVVMTAYQPTDQELTDADLDQGADSQFEVELVARAIEINEDAVEQAAKQFEDDDAGFLRSVKAIVDQAAAVDEVRPGRPQAQELDLLGEDTQQAQALADEERRRDEARNQGQESIETGKPGDLFSQARRQIDIEDVARQPASEAAAGPTGRPATEPRPKAIPPAAPAPAAPAEEIPSTPEPPRQIEDFGEKIGGARKDLWGGFLDKLGMDLPPAAQIVLSKHFPAPNYEKLAADGVPAKDLALVKAMRDVIPNKPRRSWQLKSWGQKVETIRNFAKDIIEGKFTADFVADKLVATGDRGLVDLKNVMDLYLAAGFPANKANLKGVRIRSASYSKLRGQSFDPPKTFWTIERKAKGSAFGNWPRVLGEYYESREALMKAAPGIFEAMAGKEGGQTARGKTKLDIYRETRTGKVWIGKKVAAGKYIDLKSFEQTGDGYSANVLARRYLKEHEDDLLALLEKKKQIPPVRRSINDPRIGTDYREGKDVKPEQFADTFGFRGVEFGNWVEQGKRQADLNNAYDGLLDLAGILNIPPKALALNGRLGLAFGARGKGGVTAAAAHFESGKVVINLTKKSGAGSLAHEWWHALDNYFGKQRSKGAPLFLTENAALRRVRDEAGELVDETGVRPEVMAAYKSLTDAIEGSEMFKRSRELDKRRTKRYWDTRVEMTARAFERYVIDKAGAKDERSDYLANIVPEAAFDDVYPYPTNVEAKEFEKSYDQIFSTLKTRETDTGVELFSLRDETPWYFSALSRAAEGLKQNKGGAGQMLAMLKKQPGVKKEELEWTGISEWLRARQRSVTKQEIVDFLAGNGVRLEEVQLGEDVNQEAYRRALDERDRAWTPALDALRSLDNLGFDSGGEALQAIREHDDWQTRWDVPDDEARALRRYVNAVDARNSLAPGGTSGVYIQQDQDGGFTVLDPNDEIIDIADTRAEAELIAEGATEYNEIGPGEAKFASYTLPGGENYREVLLTLPTRVAESEYDAWVEKARNFQALIDSFGAAGNERMVAVHTKNLRNAEDKIDKIQKTRGDNFVGGHFDQPNVLAHIRVNDRTGLNGERALFIEEIQSDWHQKGRHVGYKTLQDEQIVKQRREEFQAFRDRMAEKYGTQAWWGKINANEVAEHDRLNEGTGDLAGIPDAPFKGNAWAELAIKRTIRMAAEGGYDQVAWTTGEQQADRYDLSRQLNAIEVMEDATRAGDVRVSAWNKNDEQVIPTSGYGFLIISEEQLPDYIGKELADKAIVDIKRQGGMVPVRYTGLDLKVGGEGMKSFYDRVLPNLFRKVARKLDKSTRVGEINISPSIPAAGFSEAMQRAHGIKDSFDTPVHAIDITDKMRDQAMLGQPLFAMRPDVVGKSDAIESDLRARLNQVGIADRVSLKLIDVIFDKEGAYVMGARGRFANRTIEIALSTKNKQWTLDHEIIHAFRDLGVIRPAEWGVLERAARADKPRMESVRQRYAERELSEEKLMEEAIADMHANWAAGQMDAKGFIRTAFERIRAFFESLGNAFRGHGFQSASDVFQSIGRGEVGGRYDPLGRPLGRYGPTTQREALALGPDGKPVAARFGQFDPKRAARFVAPPSKPPAGPVPNQAPLFEDGFANVDESFVDYVRYKLQDRYIDLRRLQESVAPVSDEMNAYVAEELYHGKAEVDIEEAREQSMEPLLDAIKTAGLTVDEAGEYLYARHAKERNKRIAEINPLFEKGGGSGMTDAEADEIIAQYRGNEGIDQIAKLVDSITKKHRNLLVSAGLEQAETVAAWEGLYENYVPLKGLPGEQQTRPSPGRGRGFDVRGRTKRALGRESRAQSIVANLLAQYETDIIRSQKAEVGRALLKFVEAHPDQNIWEIDKVEYVGSVDPRTGLVVYRPSKRYQLADNILVVKVGGVDHHITFHGNRGQRIASAMKNMGAANAGTAIRAFASVNRMLAMVNTSLNPEFIVSNLLRDVQTAGLNLAGTEADAMKVQILRDVGKAWRGIRRAQKRKGGEWAEHYETFRKAGGKTGWIDAHNDVDRLHGQLERELKRHERGKAGAATLVRKLGEFIEAENTAVENAVRLSSFVHATEMGLSETKAASLAKNLTVNFNRRGEYGMLMNSLYLFYNASVQGNIRMLQALKSPKVRKFVGGIVVFAAMLDILNRILGGDDDDGIPRYDKIPPWVKERNLIVMNPWSEEGYFKIPLPWGYNVFHVLGQEIGEASSAAMGLQPDYKPMDSTVSLLSATLGAFNPLGSEATLSQFLSPTVTDPIVSLGENLDWAGRPIRPAENPFESAPSPDSQKYWNSTGEIPRWITKKLNDLTGGSEVRPGAIDVSPTTLEFLYEFATGGAGRFLSNVVDAPLKKIVDGEVDTYRIPFVRKVYGDIGTRATQDRFYKNLEQVYYAEQEMKLAIETKDPAMRRKIQDEYGVYLKSRLIAKETERRLRVLREQRNNIKARQMSERQRRRRLRKIEDQMGREMMTLNRRIRQFQERQR